MFRIKFAGTLVVGLALSLWLAGAARAASIAGFGGAIDSLDHHGTIGLAGQFSSTAASIVITYQDGQYPGDGVTCILSNPGDVSFSQHTVPLVMTLTVGFFDSCFRTTILNTVNNIGNSISFYYFPATATSGGSHFVGRSINLLDAGGDIIEDQTVVGTLQ